MEEIYKRIQILEDMKVDNLKFLLSCSKIEGIKEVNYERILKRKSNIKDREFIKHMCIFLDEIITQIKQAKESVSLLSRLACKYFGGVQNFYYDNYNWFFYYILETETVNIQFSDDLKKVEFFLPDFKNKEINGVFVVSNDNLEDGTDGELGEVFLTLEKMKDSVKTIKENAGLFLKEFEKLDFQAINKLNNKYSITTNEYLID